jgi:hypothetical protein
VNKNNVLKSFDRGVSFDTCFFATNTDVAAVDVLSIGFHPKPEDKTRNASFVSYNPFYSDVIYIGLVLRNSRHTDLESKSMLVHS